MKKSGGKTTICGTQFLLVGSVAVVVGCRWEGGRERAKRSRRGRERQIVWKQIAVQASLGVGLLSWEGVGWSVGRAVGDGGGAVPIDARLNSMCVGDGLRRQVVSGKLRDGDDEKVDALMDPGRVFSFFRLKKKKKTKKVFVFVSLCCLCVVFVSSSCCL